MRNYGYSEEGHQGNVKDVHLWRRILSYCRQHAMALWGAVALSLLITIASLMLPKLMQVAIDNFIATPAELNLSQRLEGLRNIVIGYGVLVGIVFCAGFTQIVLLEWAGQSIMDHVRQKLFAHILTLDMYFFHEQRVGRLVTRLTNDVQNMQQSSAELETILVEDSANCLLHVRGAHVAGQLAQQIENLVEVVVYDQPAQVLTKEAVEALSGESPVVLPLFSPRSAREVGKKIEPTVPLFAAFMSDSVKEQFAGVQLEQSRIVPTASGSAMLEATVALFDAACALEGRGKGD